MKDLKLNNLQKEVLKEKELSYTLGGAAECCGCGCHGSSSSYDNACANYDNGFSKSIGGEIMCASWGDDEWSSNC